MSPDMADTSTMLSLPSHEHGLSLHLYSNFVFNSSEFCSFPYIYRFYTYSVIFMAKCFISGDANINDTVSLISNFICSLLVYRKVVDFCILTLYSITLP
jgi:hypothetical protein